MNLQEQIAEFEAKGCVAGGRKWCPPYYMKPNKHTSILYIDYQNSSMQLTVVYCDELFSGRFSNYNFDLKSTTLEEALIEALEIVKAKVADLAKELGFVVFDEKDLNQQLQQYIEEQGNE